MNHRIVRRGMCRCGKSDKIEKVRCLDDLWLCIECIKNKLFTLEESRTKYNREVRYLSADFDTLLSEFNNDCATFTDIAEKYGVTREAVRLIYKKYFASIIPRRPNGRVRERVCIIKKRSASRSSGFLSDKRFSDLRKVCQKEHLPLDPIRTRRSETSYYSRNMVLIAGRRCNYRHGTKKPKAYKGKAFYFAWTISRGAIKNCEFIILKIKESWFIVPTKVVLELIPNGKKLYIPADGYSDYGRAKERIRHDFWQYKDAWHLLKAPASVEQSTSEVAAEQPA